jgi:hypothetical protein
VKEIEEVKRKKDNEVKETDRKREEQKRKEVKECRNIVNMTDIN